MALLCVAAFLGVASAMGARPSQRATRLESYSFAQFTEKYSRTYAAGSAEYKRREAVFQASLSRIHAVNAKNARESRPWRSDIHPFMDWTEVERKPLNSGYKSKGGRRHGGAGFLSLLSAQASTSSQSATRAKMNQTARLKMREHPRIRNQGDCGSCWAISAVEAVEAQLLQSGIDVQLSAQALIDCVPNPRHCGGKGGCDGATAELGLQFVRDYGIPVEGDLPYAEADQKCPMTLEPGASWPSARRARVSGFSSLPSNKAEPVMQALMNSGSVAIAVDGGGWMDYSSGVFDGCQKDTILSHGVLLNGYGEEGGNKYWHIQNSWGAEWGEQGTIRIKRHDNEEEWCGIDNKPQDGIACDGDPPEITVCGMCGLLYDPVLPEGARLEGGDDSSASPVSSGQQSLTPSSSPSLVEDAAAVTPGVDGANDGSQLNDVLAALGAH
jgi:cathepsin L